MHTGETDRSLAPLERSRRASARVVREKAENIAENCLEPCWLGSLCLLSRQRETIEKF